MSSQANGCLLKVAQFAGTLEEYDRAVDLFERVAAKSLENNLTKWSVREYLFKAMICVLCLKVFMICCIFLIIDRILFVPIQVWTSTWPWILHSREPENVRYAK